MHITTYKVKKEILAVYEVAVATKEKKTRMGTKPVYNTVYYPFFSS